MTTGLDQPQHSHTQATTLARRALLVTAALLATACHGPNAAAGDNACSLRVAWDSYEPYSWTENDGPPMGFDIDVMHKVAEMTGCSLTFREMAWSNVLIAIENGTADITVGTGYKTGRAAWSWYSESYRKEVIGLAVRRGAAGAFPGSSMDELLQDGFRFGKTTDDTYPAELEAVFARHPEQVLPRVSERENVERLLAGQIDGFLIEVNVGAALLRQLGRLDRVEFHPLAFEAGNYRLQMSKKTVNPERLAKINAAIQQLEASGWLAENLQRYSIHASAKQ